MPHGTPPLRISLKESALQGYLCCLPRFEIEQNMNVQFDQTLNNTPKPMLTVAGLPVTEHQIAMAKAAGIKQIVLATSYLSEIFTPYFGEFVLQGYESSKHHH